MQTLRTERLVLRMLREEDFEEYAALTADAEVMRYLGEGKPLSRGDAWRQMAFLVGHWQLRGYGMWAAEEAATGRLAGRIGFLNPEGWPGFELGWTLGREFWGRGYATEGARRALEFAFTELGRDRGGGRALAGRVRARRPAPAREGEEVPAALPRRPGRRRLPRGFRQTEGAPRPAG